MLRFFWIVQDASQFSIRGLLSYGFYSPFIIKINNFESFVRWLDRMHFSWPWISAWLVVGIQGTAIVLLIAGLGTRMIAALLLFHLLIGLFAVHWPHGFSAREDGYEIPLYYVLLLFNLVILGSGRWGLDALVRRFYHHPLGTLD